MGRGLENEIVIEDARVSRNHAEIYPRGNEWYLRDLGSTNGTYVNGYGIRERALESGDRVSLGGAELVFHSRR
jgi:pSer/pThr/pTyr-binding forkhead associated (FHA) protein